VCPLQLVLKRIVGCQWALAPTSSTLKIVLDALPRLATHGLEKLKKLHYPQTQYECVGLMKMGLWNCRYNLDMEVSRLDFKTGIEALQKQRPIKAIFLGTRLGDPDTVGLF
jgi:hypothetical protein